MINEFYIGMLLVLNQKMHGELRKLFFHENQYFSFSEHIFQNGLQDRFLRKI